MSTGAALFISLPDCSDNPLAASGRINVVQDRSFMVALDRVMFCYGAVLRAVGFVTFTRLGCDDDELKTRTSADKSIESEVEQSA